MVFKIWKITAMVCGGLVGWMIGEFKPAFSSDRGGRCVYPVCRMDSFQAG